MEHSFDLGSEPFSFFAGTAWRAVDTVKCVYIVKKEVFRKEVETEEFTGLKNFLSGDMEIAKLGVAVPPLNPANGWQKIDEELEELILKESILVTVEGPVLHTGDFSLRDFFLKEIL